MPSFTVHVDVSTVQDKAAWSAWCAMHGFEGEPGDDGCERWSVEAEDAEGASYVASCYLAHGATVASVEADEPRESIDGGTGAWGGGFAANH